ncbi:MAG: YkvA family protein [Nitrospira sp.]|nr:YkvA family protein [Nitrospira sp.]MDH4305064.1 YkvA family protein [Nitrospira sp.]MDH5193993.1 YkvA family protein [Nitrospira sp.]
MKISTRFFEMLQTIGHLWTDLPLLFRLLKAWKQGSYQGLSVRTLASIVVAILYLLSPVDAIPDFIPGIGLIDDAAILALLLHSLAQDLAAFHAWEQNRQAGS